MLIKQLSIFLENKKGRFTEVAKILGEAGVNMSAFTVAENSDFGSLRERGRCCLSTLPQSAGSIG